MHPTMFWKNAPLKSGRKTSVCFPKKKEGVKGSIKLIE
jgi:hypothetical protein